MLFVLLGTFNVKHLCRKSCFTDSKLSPVGKKMAQWIELELLTEISVSVQKRTLEQQIAYMA